MLQKGDRNQVIYYQVCHLKASTLERHNVAYLRHSIGWHWHIYRCLNHGTTWGKMEKDRR